MSSFKDYFHKKLGQKVREYREKRGYTQEEMAEILNKNLKYFGHIERNERKMSLNAIIELMEFLKVQPSEFCSFNEPYKWD